MAEHYSTYRNTAFHVTANPLGGLVLWELTAADGDLLAKGHFSPALARDLAHRLTSAADNADRDTR